MSGCLLVDGNNLLFRAHYAMERQGLKSPDGKPTGALFGFTRMLLKILREEKPEFVGVAFDVSRKTFRHQMYAEYKGTRRPTPPELLVQIPESHLLVEALGIKVMKNSEFEADDLIGSAAEFYKKRTAVRILSGDRDMLQLIDDQVQVLLCRHNLAETVPYNLNSFREEYQFAPERIVDLKSLWGDASDNIPGVDGIGEKKAMTLIRDFGSLDGVYSSLEKIGNVRMRQQLETGKESAYFSRTLATIRRDVLCCQDPRDLYWPGLQAQLSTIMPALRRWNFTSLLQELTREFPEAATVLAKVVSGQPATRVQKSLFDDDEPGSDPVPLEGLPVEEPLKPVPGERVLVRTKEDLESLLGSLGPMVAIDLETDGLSPIKNQIVGIAVGPNPEQGFYIPLRHKSLDLLPDDQLAVEEVLPKLARALVGKTLLGHNLKFDLSFLARHGIRAGELLEDTMLAGYVLDPTRPNGLKDLARKLLKMDAVDYTTVAGKKSFAEVSLGDACQYSGQDVILTWKLYQHMKAEFVSRKELAEVYYSLELPLLSLLLEMETTGIGLNRTYLRDLSKDLQDRMRFLEGVIHEQAGMPFNVNSNKQLQEVLFVQLHLPAPKKTKTGFSTDSETLLSLAPSHPICDNLLEYRELAKLKSTYADSLLDLVDAATGLIHTSFNQMVTATGRLSSSNPNLQNIPIKTELGRKVRRAFVPPIEGHSFVSLDYSQIELRLLAHFSQDPGLLKAYTEGIDIHSMTAGRLFGKPSEQVTDDERKVGKTVNFGIIYGISAHGLAAQLRISRSEAQQYINSFFGAYPQVTEFFEQNLATATRLGFVSTLGGRVRPMPELQEKNRNTRSFGERIARNTPLQGSAADLVKRAMLTTASALRDGGFATKPVLQIHDELVFSAPPAELATVPRLLRQVMETALVLRVPLICDVAIGPNLADLAEMARGEM